MNDETLEYECFGGEYRPKVYDQCKSYLTGRPNSGCKWNIRSANIFGVPLGSVLGPLFFQFLLYINDKLIKYPT
jgi:hypothetical protein